MSDPRWRDLWMLDPTITYLNHGSFGACPRTILEKQSELRARLEWEPVDFMTRQLPGLIDDARHRVAAFLDADPDGLAFVPNATTGVNAVLRSLSFDADDEIVVLNHGYNAARNAAQFVADRAGARVVEARIPFPLPADAVVANESVIHAVLSALSPRTRLAILDHVTSPTAIVLPVERLIPEIQGRGVDVLVDGAHAPGMRPLALRALGAAYYTGNGHKWLCGPKGAAFLYVREDRRAGLHPVSNQPRIDRRRRTKSAIEGGVRLDGNRGPNRVSVLARRDRNRWRDARRLGVAEGGIGLSSGGWAAASARPARTGGADARRNVGAHARRCAPWAGDRRSRRTRYIASSAVRNAPRRSTGHTVVRP